MTTETDRKPFQFQAREDGEPLTLEEAVFQALGAASVCWESPQGAGVFDSDRAKEIGDALVAFIRQGMSRRDVLTQTQELFHMGVRQMQAAYSAGLRDGPKACMTWLGNSLWPPGNLPPEGSDPDWYAKDAWSTHPWPAIPEHCATVNEPYKPTEEDT